MKYLKLFEEISNITKLDVYWCFEGFEEVEPVHPVKLEKFKAIVTDMDDSDPPYFFIMLLKFTEQFASIPFTLTENIKEEVISCVGNAEDLNLKFRRITVMLPSSKDEDFNYNSMLDFENDIPTSIRVSSIHIQLVKL